MAEAIARRTFAARDLKVNVASCGVLEDGHPVPRDVDELMSARGMNVRSHRSRAMNRSIIDGASLILGMERQHVREVVNLVPTAFPYTFTLLEFAHRLDALAESHPSSSSNENQIADLDLEAVLKSIAATRTRRDLLGRSDTDEIDDPIGRPARVFARVADEIEEAFNRVASHLWPDPDPSQADAVATTRDDNFVDDSGSGRQNNGSSTARPSASQHAQELREEARARRSSALRGPAGGVRRGRRR